MTKKQERSLEITIYGDDMIKKLEELEISHCENLTQKVDHIIVDFFVRRSILSNAMFDATRGASDG